MQSGDEDDVPAYDEEDVVVSERIMPTEEVPTGPRHRVRRIAFKPANSGGATATVTAPAINRQTTTAPGGLGKVQSIIIAKAKGYEGDPCPNCQQMTLVRSGACAKCDTCGETSGCG